MGAHMGSFEIIRALGRLNTQARISLVMYAENARKFNSVLAAVNPKLALQVIELGKVDSMLKVERALERGEIVGMLGDRTFRDEGTAAFRFLGEAAHFPTGPFRVAAMLQRPLVLMFGLYRGGNRYDIHFERRSMRGPLRASSASAPSPRRSADMWRVSSIYCRDRAVQLVNFYDFWK